MMNMKSKIIKSFIVALTSLMVITSCEVGLGEAIDITAPKVDVQAPAAMAIVQKDLLIKGVATDDSKITTIEVSVTASQMADQKFKWDGKWQSFENGAWVDYPSATISGNEQRYEFQIQTQIPGPITKKEVTITTVVTDYYSNEGSSRKDERLITVDGVAPTTTISSPVVETNYIKAQSLCEASNLKDNSVLNNLSNGDFKVKINQTENTRLGKFVLMIDEEADTTIASVDSVPNIMDLPHVYAKEIASSSRSFEIDVKNSDLKNYIRSNKHLLRIVTESYDEGGNVSRTVQGFFTYYNEADKPWTVLTLGDTEYKSGNSQKEVYPSCTLQGYAYDDDGLKSVNITVEVWDSAANKWVVDDSRTQVIDLTKEDCPTSTAWSVNALADSKHFRVISSATDINNLTGDTLTKYFRISDVNPPQITVEVLPEGESQLGLGKDDADKPAEIGKFTVKGKVEDDGPVSSIKMVRIANKNKSNFLNYYNANYAGWTSSMNGNLLFDIPMSGNGKIEGGYWKDTFEKDFYIFKDSSADGGLGINGTGLNIEFESKGEEKKEIKISTDTTKENVKNHILIFRVEDSSGSVALETYSLQGDVEPPVLTIDNVCVVPKEADTWNKLSSKVVKKAVNTTEALPSYKRDPITNEITDKLYFTGTWSDNSVAHWGDKTKIGEIYLYNNKGRLATVTMKLNADGKTGTWESELIVPEDTTTSNVQAILADFGGNTAKASASYYIASSKPTLLRITSTNPDGTYKDGDVLTIVMEYNKKVTFTDGKEEGHHVYPILVLNNGGRAIYEKGNNESKHYYKYTVGSSGTENSSFPTTTKLKVDSLEMNGNEWKDGDNSKIENPGTFTGYNLNEVRSIYVDNASPRVKKITPVTGKGNYSIKKELFFQVEFNKNVTIKNIDDVKLKVNISGKDESNNPKTVTEISAISKPSDSTVLFKYTVKAGDNTLADGSPTKLKFVSFNGGTDNILDVAKNPMTNFAALDSKDYIEEQQIYIDTNRPAKPGVTGIVDNQLYYADITPIDFTNFETSAAATRYYSFDGGTSWTVYKDGMPVKISQNGTYKVCAKQIDLAGNESDISDITTVTLDKGNLLTSISTVNPDGTYKRGDVLDIILTFRKEVKVSGSKLKLNIVNAAGNTLSREATLSTTGYNKKIHFTYTIDETDFCSKFNVTDINYGTTGYIEDSNGTLVAGTKSGKTATGNVIFESISPLTSSRDIKIVNGKPKVTKVTLVKPAGADDKERELRIEFNSEITKQSETKTDKKALYITLKQTSGFEAPAILTESQYNEYPASVTSYYKKTTNGWNSSSKLPDLSTKYVLKYEYDTDETSLVTAMKGIYKAADNNVAPDTVPIPMGSNYVKVDSSDKKILVISLKDDYTLPVQGASYSVTIPAEIVENNIGERNDIVIDSATSSSYVVANAGVETPVIRINKMSEAISGTTITQNPKTTYKVDCQTPGVTINLRTKEAMPDYVKLINNGGDNVVMARSGSSKLTEAPAFGIEISQLTSAGTIAKKARKEIGTDISTTGASATTAAAIKGYKILIEAKATKDAVSSLPSYESAMRTVIIYEEKDNNKISDDTYKNNRWLRGGDATSGGVSVADFPLTWDSSDWNKAPRTVRAMSPYNNSNIWYWVTWQINTTSYLHFLAGDIPNDADEKGPSKWWWSSCGWANMKTQTPAYAGECNYFNTAANSRYGGFNYLSGGTDGEKHREHR